MALVVAPRPVLVVMGVSGSGKTTIATLLGARLGWAVEDADDLHPAANVAKMHAGHPLDDADRAPWLARVAAWIDGRIRDGEPGVVACSALKRRYRDVLRRPEVVFVHLQGSAEQIGARLARRSGHFMPPALLDSQFEALELPGPDENALGVSTDASPQRTVEDVVAALGLDSVPL